MVAIEAVDKLLPVDVLDVVLGGIPIMRVAVDDEDFLATFRAIHVFPPEGWGFSIRFTEVRAIQFSLSSTNAARDSLPSTSDAARRCRLHGGGGTG